MAAEQSSDNLNAQLRHASTPSWIHARALWAGLSIITMWLAVLFVGVFGGDVINSSTTNGFTKIPVVVFLLPFVLPATIVVGRRGFTSTPDRGASQDLRRADDGERDKDAMFDELLSTTYRSGQGM
jgi:hypothetical protein